MRVRRPSVALEHQISLALDALRMRVEVLSALLAGLALIGSAFTAWFTLLRRGAVRMTQPTLIFFGPDGSRGPAKVYLRTLLYSTARRGRIMENMYLRLRGPGGDTLFNVWVYGEREMARGSGLFVPYEGTTCNHHFLQPRTTATYTFDAGRYEVRVFVSVVGRKRPRQILRQELAVSPADADAMATRDAGVFYDWEPDTRSYAAHLDRNPTAELDQRLLGATHLERKDQR